MSEEDYSVKYENFIPSQEEATRVRVVASNIYNLSPTNSGVRVTVDRNRQGFTVRLEIISADLRIEEYAVSSSLIQSLVGVRQKTVSKINEWKRKRFENLAG